MSEESNKSYVKYLIKTEIEPETCLSFATRYISNIAWKIYLLFSKFDVEMVETENWSEKDVKNTLFTIESTANQKYEVSMIQQSLTSVLNEYLPQWSLEFFIVGLGNC